MSLYDILDADGRTLTDVEASSAAAALDRAINDLGCSTATVAVYVPCQCGGELCPDCDGTVEAEPDTDTTEAYEKALETVRAATAKFTQAQDAYRARKIGDAEYLAARKEYEDADLAYEIVYCNTFGRGDTE